MVYSESRTSADVTWPWTCTRCRATVYHDGQLCRDCERAPAAEDYPSPTPPLRWSLASSLTKWLLACIVLLL